MPTPNRASILSKCSPLLLAVGGVFMLQSCTVGPMRAPTQTGMVLYAQGARQHTATVQLQLPPAEVYAAMKRVLQNRPDLKLINSNERRHLIEVMQGDKSVTAQATALDGNLTLLFVWTDAGESGDTGRDVALRAVNELCRELAVQCQMRDQ
jgi:hypothetical protein